MSSARYSRSGRVRPQGSGFELAVWYLMRLTGLGLFVLVLSHYLILRVLYDPAEQTASWIAEIRWSSTFWRAFDWLMLTLVLFHAFMGMRVVVSDYISGRARTIALSLLYLLAIALFAMGSMVVFTLDNVVPRA
ncbi:MAG: succinate dehydrogenase [Anaerolinea sp.]|jgi:succinate dehydrogenase / fumarate reductase membrane anchor subunit|nr:succinate dehydrogenase [Anaerolinea sp.]